LRIDFYDVDPQMFDNLMAIINEKNKGIRHPRGVKKDSLPLIKNAPPAAVVAQIKIFTKTEDMQYDDELIN
jgi:hypothetical protein